MKSAELSPRLRSAAAFVRQGAVFADVGTDHAYLPIFLLESGRIARAVCSDINEGPLSRAKANAQEHGVAEKTEFILTDGAAALADRGVTDVAICGMGGELIADIIERAEFLKAPSLRLILQPMTRAAHLRRYLAAKGFGVLAESYSIEPRHAYVTLHAAYTGSERAISPLEAEIGAVAVPLASEHRRYAELRLRTLEKAARGKCRGGEAEPPEAALAAAINNLLKEGRYM